MTQKNIKKGLFLTLPEPMMKKLEEEKKKFVYESVQEIIKEVLREKFFRQSKETGSKRGRPKEKLDVHKILSTPIGKGRPSEP